jgi:hypothetical protein
MEGETSLIIGALLLSAAQPKKKKG